MKRLPLIDQLIKRFPEIQRKELYARVLCGEVLVAGEKVQNPKQRVAEDAPIDFAGRSYVSRGGFKLEKALKRWRVEVENKCFLDAGASTGGFTDCLLQHGARLVHAVDVGYNQLDYSLRRDERVRVHERTNIMTLRRLDPMPHAAAADLSFRSLRRAASHIVSLTTEGLLIALLKPQFEYAERREDRFNGLVRDPALLSKILRSTLRDLSTEGLTIEGITPSPIEGRRGNREFLLLLRRSGESGGQVERMVDESLREAGLS
jgi:23S rRNA (cytidine1920-2'-O)/16S rRNA (cytidine1409-2'-O)-methyltransferase